MKHLGLFEGIGGFSLAARWMGWETVAWCEWNKYCQRVLKHHFPNAEAHGDITKTDFTKYANTIDILTGGFPCQPYSAAGKRKGTADDRHLWPEMLRAIRQIQPRYVVGENVRGLTNWNGGMVFDQVQADLEAEGFEVLPFLLPACAVNAPHRRDRVWFVAHAISAGKWKLFAITTRENTSEIRSENSCGFIRVVDDGATSNTQEQRLQEWDFKQIQHPPHAAVKRYNSISQWQNFPTVTPVCNRDDGVSFELDGITFPKWRNESIQMLGNAIVPQVAYQIFKAIEQYESL